ncbi:MAG: Endo-1,4-beta-xylanase Z [Gemmatimonadaceae bacterium]|nr:Endo-1,4-beta-xylanase Z [Gemmatimonadaceae bacterium]
MEMHAELDRRAFIRQLAVLAGGAATAACSAGVVTGPRGFPPDTTPPVTPPTSLDGMFVSARARGLTFGCGLNYAGLSDAALLAAHTRESGMVVPIAQGAWNQTHPGPSTWNFSVMDDLWSWAQSVHLPMRGTHLVWHQALPAWFSANVTSANASQYMRDHIQAFLGRYKGLFHSWNPVNEAVLPSDGRPDGLRNSPWLQLMGPQYIPQAFNFAAQVDPSATLVYNEFGIEEDTPLADRKRQFTLQLLQSLVQQGVPIHALGMQSHIAANSAIDASKLTAFLDAVAALGLRIFITELDVKDQTLPANIAARDAGVAAMYHTYLSAMLAHPAVSVVITWGLSDRLTWLTNQAPRPDGLPVRVLPLDDQLQRKPAWTAIVNSFTGR